jgi:hypothetical protein
MTHFTVVVIRQSKNDQSQFIRQNGRHTFFCHYPPSKFMTSLKGVGLIRNGCKVMMSPEEDFIRIDCKTVTFLEGIFHWK